MTVSSVLIMCLEPDSSSFWLVVEPPTGRDKSFGEAADVSESAQNGAHVHSGSCNNIYHRVKRIQGDSTSQLLRTITRLSMSIDSLIANLCFPLAA